MKVIGKTSDVVEQIGDITTREFTIKANAKAFSILSKGIYSDSITPPIRELATNAYDSHVAAGNENVKFQVHLPTILEPWFSVRDFGVGMNADEVEKIYTTYFESTKTESNDYIGCLGLGSKSPFCYTDSFSVISVQNGTRWIYTCFLENDVPHCAKIGEEKTNDPNGMLIQFSVDEKDISTFQRYSEDIYNRFLNRPEILNCPDFKYRKSEYSYSGDGWSIIKRDDTQSSTHTNHISYALMGNIAYPIQNNNLNLSNYSYNLSDDDSIISAVLSSGIEITFPIGQLEIAASRESLHFDDRTIRNVKNRCLEVFEDIKNVIDDMLNKCKNLWEARCLYHDIFVCGSYFSHNLSKKLENRDYYFKNTKIESSSIYKKNSKLNAPMDFGFYEYRSPKSKRGEYKARKDISSQFVCKRNHIIIVNDLKTGGVARLREYIESENEGGNKIRGYVFGEDDNNLKFVLQESKYPKANIVKTSTLPKVKSNRAYNPKDRCTFKKMIRTYSWNPSGNWADYTIEDKKVGEYIYVETYKHELQNSNSTRSTSNFVSFGNMKDILIKIGAIDKDFTLIGVPRHRAKQVKNLPNWTNLYEFADKHIKKYIDENEAVEFYANYKYSYNNSFECNIVRDICKLKYSKFLELKLNEIEEFTNGFKNHKTDLEFLDDINLIYKIRIDDSSVKFNIHDVKAEIFNRYPMLKHIGTSYNDNPDIKDYIELVEKTIDNK